LAASAHALPAPDWRFPAFPLRTVFSIPPEARTNLMLKLPRSGAMPVTPNAFYACDAEGRPLSLRVAHADADEVVLLLDVSRSDRRSGAVYYGAAPGGSLARAPEAAPDETPLAMGVLPLQGRAIPTSWDRLRHMLKGTERIRTPYQVADFDEIEPATYSRGEERRPGRHRHGHGVRAVALRSFLLCSRAGSYRFAVDCADAGFVAVDGEPVAAWPGEHEPRDWQLGAPVALKAGVHRLDVFNVFDGAERRLRVGWQTPGRRDVAPIRAPDLVSACEATETRDERMDRTLQPGFVATPVRAYSFRGHPSVFVETQCRNLTENWIASEMGVRWRFGDGAASDENNPVHVYTSADSFKVSLEVRDRLGFVAACSESVDCRQITPEEYAVSFDLTGLPAACFGRDKAAPFLKLEGSGPADMTVEASWERIARNGGTEQDGKALALSGATIFLPLPPISSKDTDTLRWRVRHRRVTLVEETIKFVRAPFDTLPVRVEGDRLFDAEGRRLVLVPEEAGGSVRQPVLDPGRRFERVVCVDDSLAVAGLAAASRGEPFDRVLTRLLTGRAQEVRYAMLPAWDAFEESYGPLRKLVDVPDILRRERPDVAMVSIGLRDILELKDADAFERQVAALSDLVAGRMSIPMVWVTPPPYAAAPERSRVFAAVIRRVAEARGIPVADLYTAFQCATDSRHVFFQENPLMLSAEGHRLAGQQMARALVGE
jgi:hypothetical protein